MTETDLIEKYLKTDSRTDVLLGIGDDAALLDAQGRFVMSLDSLVVERHFRKTDNPADVGYKSLAVNLSDLAAMGCVPCWAMLSLSLPPEIGESWIGGFIEGFLGLAKYWNVSLIGGDLVRGPLVITVQVTGRLNNDTKPLLRSGAQTGDAIYITGDVGGSGIAWHCAELVEKNMPAAKPCRERLLKPEPRINEGCTIAMYATAAVDISDGVLLDLSRLTKASRVGAELNLDTVPVHPAVMPLLPEKDWLLPFTAGDDYELLFTMPPSAETNLRIALRQEGILTPVTRVGHICNELGLHCRRHGQTMPLPEVLGFDHFGAQIK